MTTTDVAQRKTRLLAVVLLVGAVVLTGLWTLAAVSSGPGESRVMFTLLAASAVASGLGAAATLAAARSGGGWLGLVVVLLATSVALILMAATRDGGTALPVALMPLLLVYWWMWSALRGATSPQRDPEPVS